MTSRPLLIGGVALAVVVGVAAAYLLLADPLGWQRPAPPCPEGWLDNADGTECQRMTEVCNAHYVGPVRDTVSCTADSPDGKGTIEIQFTGPGRAIIEVLSGDRVLYTRTVTSNVAGDVDRVSGPRGTWTLRVAFETSGGSGRIVVYG